MRAGWSYVQLIVAQHATSTQLLPRHAIAAAATLLYAYIIGNFMPETSYTGDLLWAMPSVHFAPNVDRSPLGDVDLSASTDFEDGLVVAVDCLFLVEHDASVWADGTSFHVCRPWRASSGRVDVVVR